MRGKRNWELVKSRLGGLGQRRTRRHRGPRRHRGRGGGGRLRYNKCSGVWNAGTWKKTAFRGIVPSMVAPHTHPRKTIIFRMLQRIQTQEETITGVIVPRRPIGTA